MEFYEKVKVGQNASFAEYAGRVGVVGGISDGADGVTYYAVKFEDDDVVMFPGDQLESLGDKASPDEMFPGGSVKVTVDEKGHAEIVEDNPPQRP
ncbi:hypothetical protein LO763_18850 [Glycomyces sp. A-F 0318]|uniref:hypothetical protein n=1 Tax=Glycomyces amatae TaxID=2881355 RepID=UPI001E59A433|nr:hypothetical protein [Glycomyces amatae]MCD0445669.1 hypothetical protein [Glycomyces amatae]